jgi:hypothetical protein
MTNQDLGYSALSIIAVLMGQDQAGVTFDHDHDAFRQGSNPH